MIFRFDGDGVADSVVGELPKADTIYEPTDAMLDHLGRLLVFDERTSIVHVFDSEGRHQRTIGAMGARSGQFQKPQLGGTQSRSSYQTQ